MYSASITTGNQVAQWLSCEWPQSEFYPQTQKLEPRMFRSVKRPSGHSFNLTVKLDME